jgi:hypothetical protein
MFIAGGRTKLTSSVRSGMFMSDDISLLTELVKRGHRHLLNYKHLATDGAKTSLISN